MLEMQRLIGTRRDQCLYLGEDDMRKFPRADIQEARVIVADATHPTAARRKLVLDWARKHGYLTTIVHVATSRKLCEHLNMARAQLSQYLVPIIAHRVYWKNLELPEKDGRVVDFVITTRFHPTADAPPEVTEFRY